MADSCTQEFLRQWHGPIEETLKQYLESPDPALQRHYGMMEYHMGWVNASMEPRIRAAGKRLRPTLLLLVCAAMGKDPRQSLAAAGSMEILHNYSLLHDDIEDLDEVRRHYPTVWKVWGNGQAINAGDGMYACAFEAMLGLRDAGVSADLTLQSLSLLSRACVQLTEGQFLDLDYEIRSRLTLAEYFFMVKKKTAALFSTCLEVGALLSNCNDSTCRLFGQLGETFGIAYQMLDDLANIWGETDETGKTSCKDIVQRKKSLPIVIAMGDIQTGDRLRSLYALDVEQDIAQPVLEMLQRQGVRERCLVMLGQRKFQVQGLINELRCETSSLVNTDLSLLEAYLDSLLVFPPVS